MDDYEYEDDSEGEFEEEDDFEDEFEIEEDDFEDEVEIEEEEEDFEEEVEDDDEEDFEEIIENDEDSEEEEDFEEEFDEEDSEEIEEQDDLIPLEMTSRRVYEEEEEEVSEFVPSGMTSHRIIHEDEDNYMDEEVRELVSSLRTSSRIVYEDDEEQLDELIPPQITSPSPRVSVINEDETEQVNELVPPEITPPGVLLSATNGSRAMQGSVAINDGLVNDSNESERNLQANHDNGNVADVCPICFEAWTSGGNHQVCCLPCGHVYGMSCIKKWVQSSGKCPQCKSVCTLKDIIVLYATRLCVADKELHNAITTGFPFTKEGFSALQQYAVSLHQRVEAMSLKADDIRSRMNLLEQKCNEHMGSEQQNTER